MKNSIIVICLFLSWNVFAQKELLKNKLIADNFIVYDPPIKIKGASFVDEPVKPIWYKTYCANVNPLEFETAEEAISYFEIKPTVEKYTSYKINFPNREEELKDVVEYICGGYRLRFVQNKIDYLILFTKIENKIIDTTKPFMGNMEENLVKFEIYKLVNNKFVHADFLVFKSLLEKIGYKGEYDFDFNGEFQKVLLEQGFTVATKKNRSAGLSDVIVGNASKKSPIQPIPEWLQIKE
ncbi:MAG: hypothetical protein V4572_00650 [Bacteroidota bacterium]